MDTQLVAEYDIRIFMARWCEFGEHEVAKPKRSDHQLKKGVLAPRFQDATWVRYMYVYMYRYCQGQYAHRGCERRRSSSQGKDSETKSRRRAMDGDCDQDIVAGANAVREAWTLVLREGRFLPRQGA